MAEYVSDLTALLREKATYILVFFAAITVLSWLKTGREALEWSASKRRSGLVNLSLVGVNAVAIMLPLLATGCAWVKLEPQARPIRVAAMQEDLSACTRLGEIAVSVKDGVGPVGRNPIKVRDELETLARNAVFPVRYAAFALVAAVAPVVLAEGPVAWVVAYVLVDATYYAKHRWLHHNGLLWALHMPHHSVRVLTADSALRLGWIQRLFDDFFYLPLALLGFPAWTLLMAVELNHLYQWWCHAEWIGRLPWLDPWLNTPSNHRVHHGSTPGEVQRNFGSTFMIWDRLMGTYRPEPAGGISRFGVDIGYEGNNPVRFQLTPLARYLRSLRS